MFGAMAMKRTVPKALLLSLILGLTSAQPALAYIDPNTGGMLFQILAVAFASVSALLLIFSRQIRMRFARAKRGMRSVFGKNPESGPPSTSVEGSDPEAESPD
jgi:hypothetical protein